MQDLCVKCGGFELIGHEVLKLENTTAEIITCRSCGKLAIQSKK